MTDAGPEPLLRELVPRVLAAVLRRFGDFASAEDAVQDALLAAVVDWRERGVPDNPGGWLFEVACRRMHDHRDSERARRRREERAAARAHAARPHAPAADEATEGDDTLALLFLCCHPAVTQPSAIALTLRAVGGLTTAEIAAAFLVPESTMAQRISRAKQSIASSEIAFRAPTEAERRERLPAVLHVLYLIFSEGYASSAGPSLQRVELAAEAIRLARLLHAVLPDDGETAGLLALMLLTHARRHARSGPLGELIPLDEQDRVLWDRAAIAAGTALVERALGTGVVGPYGIQAAIAALHAEAPSVEATDWPQILALYGLLERMTGNPVVRLNRVIAFSMVHGPRAGLDMLRALEAEPRLARGHRLDAIRAHLLERAGEHRAAIEHYRAAAARTGNLPERQYLIAKAARLEAPS